MFVLVDLFSQIWKLRKSHWVSCKNYVNSPFSNTFLSFPSNSDGAIFLFLLGEWADTVLVPGRADWPPSFTSCAVQ